MTTVASLVSPRTLLAGITLLSSLALSSSLYLQYVALYQPCRYCYSLRYLTAGILIVSLFGQLVPRLTRDIAASTAAASMIGVGVSLFLVVNEALPTEGICTACAFAPFILGVSLYYYSLVFMAMVLGLSLTVMLWNWTSPQA